MSKLKKSIPTRAFKVSIDQKRLKKRIDTLVVKAQRQALEEVTDDKEARARVRTALRNRLRPYLLEAEIIAKQLLSPEYAQFKEETRQFYNALVNVVACPDGRISVLALTDPRAAYAHRLPRGQVPTRLTTRREMVSIPANTALRSSIWTALRKRKKAKPGVKPRLVALVGPHINSGDPTHGCGGAAKDLSDMGSGMPVVLATLRFGGARNYFRILQGSGEYYALNNFVDIAGGKGTTVDYTHDLYSQGVIIGLGSAWQELKASQSLRKNLIRLHRQRKIVMSEFLAKTYARLINAQAKKFDPEFSAGKRLNYRQPMKFAYHAMMIGKVARQLTLVEEKKGYPFFPKRLAKNYDSVALRIAAYHLLRSAVYLVLGKIIPGKHWLIHHPEQLLRVGPIGADFNVKTIAFIETTPPGLSGADVEAAFMLYGLMERVLPTMKVDLTREARLLIVTGGFDPNIYKDEEAIEENYNKVATTVIDDAAMVKQAMSRAVSEGAAVVIPMIHHTGNRSVIDVV